MTNLTFGDLAMSFHSRSANARIKADLQRLGTEMTSGRTSDIRGATGGDLGPLAGLNHALGTLSGYKTSAAETGTMVEAVQRSLARVQDSAETLGPALLLASSSGQVTQIQSAASDIRAQFSDVVSALNVQIADRTVLAGTATGGAALAGADVMLGDLQTVITAAGATTAADVETVVNAWFDDPAGGFETVGYLGSNKDIAPIRIGMNESASLPLRADSGAIREVLKAYAMGALVAEGTLAGNDTERAALLNRSAHLMLAADRSLSETRASIGAIEARIELVQAHNAAETSALELAQSEILSVDPYETATNLTAVQSQLETLYTVTARLSRLSLAEYLR